MTKVLRWKQRSKEVVDSFTAQINPATGQHYAYPADFDFTTWFTVLNEKVEGHYKYEGWWGYDSLPVIDAPPAPLVIQKGSKAIMNGTFKVTATLLSAMT